MPNGRPPESGRKTGPNAVSQIRWHLAAIAGQEARLQEQRVRAARAIRQLLDNGCTLEELSLYAPGNKRRIEALIRLSEKVDGN
jgi:hypothetical protein